MTISPSNSAPNRSSSNGAPNWAAWITKSSRRPWATAATRLNGHRQTARGLETLPFFGGGKVVWLRDCNFLGEERAASAQAVTETLAELAEELKKFAWQNVRLLISAGKVDKRKAFFKTLDKLGTVGNFTGWSADDKDWAERAEIAARTAVRARQKEISEEALAELVNRVGPHARQLEAKLKNFACSGDRKKIELADVAAICSRNKTARAFALGDALGDRNLPPCSVGWTRSFGKRSSTRTNRKSVCFTV
jgi:DNA polymerase-3 subunit delta